MKTIFKITFLLMLPILSYSQQSNVATQNKKSEAGNIRFTDKFGPFQEKYQEGNDFSNKKFAEYSFIREADVYWSKVTWQIIDLREKQNLPLYYPIDPISNRKSLIKAILDGIESGDIVQAYKVPLLNNEFEFNQEDLGNVYLDVESIKDIGKREQRINRPGMTDTTIVYKWKPEEIKQILVKEVWYIDKKDSRLKSEIIGLCPMREYKLDPDDSTYTRQRLFWIYYPEARKYFAKVPVYSMVNDKPMYSFDDLFVNRYFSSFFVQEANVYNDRMITDYVIGREAQLESQRIKNDIFKAEQDLWEN